MKKILLLILVAGTWYLAAMYESRLLLGISMTGIIGMLVFFVLPKIQIRLFSAAFSEPTRLMTRRTPDHVPVKTLKKGLFPLPNLKFKVAVRYDGQQKPEHRWFTGGCRMGQDQLELPFQAPYSGMMEMDLLMVKAYDPFRIFSSSRKADSRIKIAVLPQILLDETQNRERPFSNERQQGEQQSHRPGEDGDLRQIRPWVPGDMPRHVHWKLSARMQETMIREWNEEDRSVSTLTLEREKKEYTEQKADLYYEALCQEVLNKLAENALVQVIWNDHDGIPMEKEIRVKKDLEELLIHLFDTRYLWEGRL